VRNRWARIAAVVLVLVVVNFAARVIIRLANGASDGAQFNTALASLVAMGVVLAVTGFFLSRRFVLARAAGDLFFMIVSAALIVTLVGPFVSGGTPFGAGSYAWTMQLLVCLAALLIGSAIGVLLAIAFGLDPKSRAWAAYAASVKMPANAARPGKARAAKPGKEAPRPGKAGAAKPSKSGRARGTQKSVGR
jgi:hypothetical protein